MRKLLLGLFLIPATLYSQVNLQSTKNIKAEAFFEIVSQDFLLSVADGRGDIAQREKRVQYSPSATTVAGVRFQYKIFGWSFKSNVFGDSESHVDKYGASKFYDFRTDVELGNSKMDFYYRTYEGFYADLNSSSGFAIKEGEQAALQENVAEENTYSLEERIIKRPDLKSQALGTKYHHTLTIFHPFKSRENKLVDSNETFGLILDLIGSIHYDYYHFYGNKPFLPQERMEAFGHYTLSSIQSHTLGGRVGFVTGYYFTPKNSLLLSMQAGRGLQRLNLVDDEGQQVQWGVNTLMDLRIGYQFTGETQFGKIGVDMDIVGGKTGKEVFVDTTAYTFYAGYGVAF